MFRQVISIRWAPGVTDAQKQGYRGALEGLRVIPELVDMRWGDDVGIFDGNFDFVVVMDFADFPAARRYVGHPLHQAYVRDHAKPLIGERVVVQHEWQLPPLRFENPRGPDPRHGWQAATEPAANQTMRSKTDTRP